MQALTFRCSVGETCQKIDDIGYGDVGCCPAGSTCTGNLSGCGDDKISCLRSVGGGCCNKGSMCTRRGCIVDPALGAKIESEGSASIAPTGAGLGAVIGVTVGTETPSPTIPARRPISTETSLCDDGWRACAAAAGGGCCPQDYNCGVRNCPAKRMLVTQMVDGVAATLTVQMSPVPKRSQNVFIPITPAEAVGMRASDVRWLLTVPVVLGMAIGGVLVL